MLARGLSSTDLAERAAREIEPHVTSRLRRFIDDLRDRALAALIVRVARKRIAAKRANDACTTDTESLCRTSALRPRRSRSSRAADRRLVGMFANEEGER